MIKATPTETFVEETVTYAAEIDGRFYLVENVPARVCVETGEQLFAPETVERLQRLLWSGEKPVRTVDTPVLDFAA